MATGMVLIIVTRNIDLSVGSVVAVVGMVDGRRADRWLPGWIGFDHRSRGSSPSSVGLVLGAAIGAFQGVDRRVRRGAVVHRDPRGFLVWRGVAWWIASGQTIAPMDTSSGCLGGGAEGSIGGTWSWIVGLLACVAIVAMQAIAAAAARRYGFRLRPMWAEVALGVVACGAVLGGHLVPEPLLPARGSRRSSGGEPPGTEIPLGLAFPVLIAIGAAIVMTFIATRRRFGRYVYAIGGNPEAAELAGIKTKRTIVKTFVFMGLLVGLAAAVQIARLNAAVSSLGTGRS